MNTEQHARDAAAIRGASTGILLNAAIDLVWCTVLVLPMMFCGAGLCLMLGGMLSLVHLWLGWSLRKTPDDQLSEVVILAFSPFFSLICLNPFTFVVGFIRFANLSDAMDRIEGEDEDEDEDDDTDEGPRLDKARIKALPRDVRSIFKGKREDWLNLEDEDPDLVVAALEDTNVPRRVKSLWLHAIDEHLLERLCDLNFSRIDSLSLYEFDDARLAVLAKASWLERITNVDVNRTDHEHGEGLAALLAAAPNVVSLGVPAASFLAAQVDRPLERLIVHGNLTQDVIDALPPVVDLFAADCPADGVWPALPSLTEIYIQQGLNESLAERLIEAPALQILKATLSTQAVRVVSGSPALTEVDLTCFDAFEGLTECLRELVELPLANVTELELDLNCKGWDRSLLEPLTTKPKLRHLALKGQITLTPEDLAVLTSVVYVRANLTQDAALELESWEGRHPGWSLSLDRRSAFEGDLPTEAIRLQDNVDFNFTSIVAEPVWVSGAEGGGVVGRTADGGLSWEHNGHSSGWGRRVVELAGFSSHHVVTRQTDGTVSIQKLQWKGRTDPIDLEAPPGRLFGDPERLRALIDTGSGVQCVESSGLKPFPSSLDLADLVALAAVGEDALWIQRDTGELEHIEGSRGTVYDTGPLCQTLVPSPSDDRVLGYGFEGLVLWDDDGAHHLVEEPVVYASWQKLGDGAVVVFEERVEVRLADGTLHASLALEESVVAAVRTSDALLFLFSDSGKAWLWLHPAFLT